MNYKKCALYIGIAWDAYPSEKQTVDSFSYLHYFLKIHSTIHLEKKHILHHFRISNKHTYLYRSRHIIFFSTKNSKHPVSVRKIKYHFQANNIDFETVSHVISKIFQRNNDYYKNMQQYQKIFIPCIWNKVYSNYVYQHSENVLCHREW